jgi:phosphoserine phosphatase RsbX
VEAVMLVEWGCAGTAYGGGTESGDRGVVVPFPGGLLVAVIDGLGHGVEAKAAALKAEGMLLAAPYAPVDELMRRCHEELKGTRGAVISLASFDAATDTMTWLGVGNVEALLVRGEHGGAAEAVAMRGGTVGYMLPPLHPRSLRVNPGDTLALATDGVRHGFKAEIMSAREPQHIADEILRVWGKTSDDSYVIVARYKGASESQRIGIDGEGDVVHARNRTRDLARGVGLQSRGAEELVLAVSELARNIVAHAREGEIVIQPMLRGAGVTVVARDLGPGIADVELALRDGYTTRNGMGCGLSAVRRLVDKLEILTTLGVGTVVTIEKWIP